MTASETPAVTPGQEAQAIAQQLARQAQQRAIRARRKRQQRQAKLRQAGRAPAAAPVQRSPTQRQGRHAEARALAYLADAGLTPLARNLSCKAGEIDLVCLDGGTLVFVEVRERQDARYGGAAASIGRAKQRRLIRAAQFWLPSLRRRHFQGRMPVCRFDAVALNGRAIEWIRHAFELDEPL